MVLKMLTLVGKHARHINCCSPVGDWLDHSLDIISYLLILSNLCAAVQLVCLNAQTLFHPIQALTWKVWLILSTTALTYELVMWECYFSGTLVINEVDASTGMSVGIVIVNCYQRE